MHAYGCSIIRSVLLFSSVLAVLEACDDLVIDPPHLLVQYGAPAQASCSTKEQKDMIVWDSPVEDKQGGGTQLLWNPKSVTEWALGKGIMCYTLSDAGSPCHRKLNITIYKHPDRVSIRPTNDVGGLTEGDSFQLECVVEDIAPVSHLKVTWFRGQEQLREDLSTGHIVDGNPNENVTVTYTLYVNASRDDHGAQYRCEATLELEGLHLKKSSQPLGISVFFAPVINCPSKVQVREDNSLPNCTAEGNPSPEVMWFKGHQLDPLSLLSRKHGGQYIVTAKNRIGAVNQTVDIEVLYGPVIICPRTLAIRENEALKGCRVEGNPSPEVIWYRGNHKFDPASKLGKMDGGNYTLFAESTASSVQRSVDVVIISKGNNISMSGGCFLLAVLFIHIYH